jgi:hypothetical protein
VFVSIARDTDPLAARALRNIIRRAIVTAMGIRAPSAGSSLYFKIGPPGKKTAATVVK